MYNKKIKTLFKNKKLVVQAIAILIVVVGISVFIIINSHANPPIKTKATVTTSKKQSLKQTKPTISDKSSVPTSTTNTNKSSSSTGKSTTTTKTSLPSQSSGGGGSSSPPAPTYTLSSYYPNPSRYSAGYYLSGNNYANPQSPSYSVLWFQTQQDGSFKQYNSSPSDPNGTCHWDQLSWGSGSLVYSETNDQCGSDNNQIEYSPGITYMPNTWQTGQSWSDSGSSAATYYDGGTIACQGTNTWTSTVLGWVQMTYGKALHIQNNQSTSWTSGSDPSGCHAGYTTTWQENFYLAAGLPVAGTNSTDLALLEEAGGNVDTYNSTGEWDYDVIYNSWAVMP